MKIPVFIFLVLLLVNVVSATQIWTNEEIRIHSIREKIEVSKEVVNGQEITSAIIKDIIYFNVPKNLQSKKVFFAIFPPYKDALNYAENISELEIVSCGAGNARTNYSLDETWGLDCLRGALENLSQDLKVNGINLIEFNTSGLDWSNPLGENFSKEVYLSLNYKMNGLILNTESYNTIWAKKIQCHYNSPNCLNDGTATVYVSIPTSFFIVGGYNYQLLWMDQNDKRMVFISKDSKEDLVLSYEDTQKEKFTQLKWFVFGIFLSFVLSLIANKFSGIPKVYFFLVVWGFIFLLIVLGSIIFYYGFWVIGIFLIISLLALLLRVYYFLLEENGFEKLKKTWQKNTRMR